MEMVLELLMIAALCAAVAVQLFRQIHSPRCAGTCCRTALAALGTGFLIGAVNKILAAPSSQIFLAYLFGFMLSYIAFVMTFQERKTMC